MVVVFPDAGIDFLKAIALCVGDGCHFRSVAITFLSPLNEKQREKHSQQPLCKCVCLYAIVPLSQHVCFKCSVDVI